MNYIQRLNADNERAGQQLKAAHERQRALREQQRQLDEALAWAVQERRQLLLDMGINPDAEAQS